MAAERDNGVTSDAEASEKPVREQLKKASISKASGEDANMATDEHEEVEEAIESNGHEDDSSDSRGRLQKKRSYEDFEAEDQEEHQADHSQRHSRKRSRDSTAEENELNNGQRKSTERARDGEDAGSHAASNGQPTAPANDRPATPEQSGAKRGEAAVEEMTSPKSKRSRLHPSTGENGLAETAKAGTEPAGAVAESTMSEPKQEDDPAAKVAPTRGFANTSATSGFAALSSSKAPAEEPLQTSTSAFNASGFSSFSASSGSGFGAIGKSTGGFGGGGGFGSGATTTKTVDREDESTGSVFGGSLGQKSVFGSAPATEGGFGSTSGFGSKLGQGTGFASAGSGFGSLGGGSGLTSFASGKPSSSLLSSSKPSKVFGAPADEEEEGEDEGGDDDAGFKSPLSQESDKQDERFYEQELETGEEDEIVSFSNRAKLYNFVAGADGKKEWKERGLGVVRLNVKRSVPDDEDSKPLARLLMRADGSHRVILNTPIKKEIKFGSASGGQPQGGLLLFMGTVDGKTGLEMLQLKMRQQVADELYEKVMGLQGQM